MNNETKSFAYDAWLSGLMGRDSYKMTVDDALIEQLTDPSSEDSVLLRELQSQPVFIYTKAPTAFISHCSILEQWDFRLIDTNVHFDKPVIAGMSLKGSADIRFACAEDQGGVMTVARSNFIYSRFHLDPLIPNEIANEIKAQWAGNFFSGARGNLMVTAHINGKIVGFLQLLTGDNGVLIIDLVAVDASQRGKGIAGDMILFAEQQTPDCQQMIVGTQVANVPSIRFYERMGFRLRGSQYVFHYHTL